MKQLGTKGNILRKSKYEPLKIPLSHLMKYIRWLIDFINSGSNHSLWVIKLIFPSNPGVFGLAPGDRLAVPELRW